MISRIILIGRESNYEDSLFLGCTASMMTCPHSASNINVGLRAINVVSIDHNHFSLTVARAFPHVLP